MNSKRFNIERSREVRLWIGTGIKAISSLCMFDYVFNNGDATRALIAKAKNKSAELKETIRMKKEGIKYKVPYDETRESE